MAGGRIRRRGGRAPDAACSAALNGGSTSLLRSTVLSAMESFLANWEVVQVPNSKFTGALSAIYAQLKISQIDSVDSELYKRLGTVLFEMGKANLLSKGDIRMTAIRLTSLLPTACFISQPSEALYFYARIAAACKDPYSNSTEASILLLALHSGNSLLSERQSMDRILLLEAVRGSAAPLCDAICCALFPAVGLGSRNRPSANISDSVSSSREIDTDFTSDFDRDEVDPNSSMSAAENQTSKDAVPAGNPRRSRDGAWSTRSRLRFVALDILCSLSSVSSMDLIPYWGLFLPDRDGVNNHNSNFPRKTLANIILHDPSESIRGAGVGAAISLISNTWRFTRSQGPGPLQESSIAGHSFTSTGARVLRACVALYVVTATAIRHETASGVLARLMKLATELCHNARVPSVSSQRIMYLVDALRLRLFDSGNIDRTSRAAGLSCLATALPMMSGSLRTTEIDDIISSLILVLRETTAPVAETLSAIQAAFECEPCAASKVWQTLHRELLRHWNMSAKDQVVRLHVLRTVQSVLERMSSEAQSSDLCLDILSGIWFQFIHPSFMEPFHALRSRGVQCVETLFRALANLKAVDEYLERSDYHFAVSCVTATGLLLQKDESTAVRSAAVKALSETPMLSVNDDIRRSAYEILIRCLRTDSNMGVRSRAMLAGSNLVENGYRWLKFGPVNAEEEFAELLGSHKSLAIAFLSSKRTEINDNDLDCADNMSTSVNACQADWEAMRSSSVRALGSFLSGCVVGSELELDGFLTPGDVRGIVGLVCRVTSNIDESPKIRWNGCHVLGRFLMVQSPPSSGLEHVRAEVNTVLVSAVLSGDNFKVRIAAVKSLRKSILSPANPGIPEIGKITTASMSVLAEHRGDGFASCPTVGVLRGELESECLGLLAETLHVVDTETCRKLGESGTVSSELLFNGLWKYSGLPGYALLALDEHEKPSLREEYLAALDAWKDLPPALRCAFRSAGNIGNHIVQDCIFKRRLLLSALLVAESP
jgi:Domain of unknown function (DUF4042)